MKYLKKFLVLIPLMVTFLLYKDVIKGTFNLEDSMFLGDAAKVLTRGNLKYIFLPWHGNYARFFRQPISVLLYKVFGYNATPFFALSLLFHLSNVFLVYLLAIKLTKSKLISFFSSLFYGIYQVNFECLMWISAGNKDLPMTTFFMISLIFLDRFLIEKKQKYLFFSYLFFFLCFSCEFKAFTVPLVFLFWEIIIIGKGSIKQFINLNNISRYFVFFLIELFWMITYYRGTITIFSGAKNWNFWQAFPASLPFYFLPTNRVFWIKIYTNAWGITQGHLDEPFLKEFGLLILIFFFSLIIYLWKNKESQKARVLLLLIIGVFLNYLPVMLTILSNFFSLWQTVTIHWRYFTLASPLASILVVTSLFWFNEEVLNILRSRLPKLKLLSLPFKLKILPLTFLLITTFFYVEYDQFMLKDFFLKWSIPAKEMFVSIKKTYPSFSKESVLVIEGVEDEQKQIFFDYRYLFGNIFALYADPNNPNYLQEIQRLPFDPKEMFMRKLVRLKYYTNLKDFLVGNYQHIYEQDNSVTWMDLNLPWILPAYDRLFLGSAYGLYEPDNIYVLKIDENGLVTDLTSQRKKELKDFLNYFCFEKGIRTCSFKSAIIINDPEVKNSFINLSKKGQEIFKFLLAIKETKLPEIYDLKVN